MFSNFFALKVVTRIHNNKSVTGFATILTSLAKESKSNIATNTNQTREIEAQVYQWIEFAILYVAPGSKDKHVSQQLLRDFDKLFLKQSYLVGYFLTLADLAVFYAIYDLVVSCLILFAEKLWFYYFVYFRNLCPPLKKKIT